MWCVDLRRPGTRSRHGRIKAYRVASTVLPRHPLRITRQACWLAARQSKPTALTSSSAAGFRRCWSALWVFVQSEGRHGPLPCQPTDRGPLRWALCPRSRGNICDHVLDDFRRSAAPYAAVS